MKTLLSSGVRRCSVLAAIVLAAGLPAIALAQEGGEDAKPQLRGSFDRPLTARSRVSAPAEQGASHMVVTNIDGDDNFTLTMSGDNITVEHNGKHIPADRIKRDGGTIKVLDKKGEVIHTFETRPMAAIAPIAPVPPMAPIAPRAPRAAIATTNVAPPPVMVGMLMDYSDDEEGIVVQHVFDGMPAAKGGMKDGDVIVKIDGNKVDSNKVLRDALMSKKPGDSLKVVVERDGDEKDLSIELVKYDEEALAKARGEQGDVMIKSQDNNDEDPAGAMSGGGVWDALPMLGGNHEIQAEVKKAIEQALAQIKHGGANDVEQWKGEAVKSLEQALESMEKQSAQLRTQLRALGNGTSRSGNRSHAWTVAPNGGAGGGSTLLFREMPGQVFEVPATPRAASPKSEQLDKLTEAIDRLNKRLDDMEKKMHDKK